MLFAAGKLGTNIRHEIKQFLCIVIAFIEFL